MKASELIYRLARAIEANGDCDVRVAVEGVAGGDTIHKDCFEAEVKCMDVNKTVGGDLYFEIYGEEQ